MPDGTLPRGLIARTVREALDAVVAPEVGLRVLDAALRQTELSEVPEDPDRFKAFLGPFRVIALESLGDEVTSLLFGELEHLAERAITSRLPPRFSSSPSPRPRQRISSPSMRPSQAGSGYRRSKSSDQGAPPNFRLTPQKMYAILAAPVPDVGGFEPGAGKVAARVILLCSTDSALEGRIAAWVGARAQVLVCQNLTGLVTLLGGGLEPRVVVFVDCRRPTFRPMSLGALSDELPPQVEVVLWGATPSLVNELTQLFAATRQWMVCAPTLGEQEAVERCVELMSLG